MRILICDDHALFRDGLELVLREVDADCDFLSLPDGESVLAAVAEDDDLDIVLLDLALPGADGFSILRALRRDHPTVPVVVLSASESVEDMRKALDLGASGYIPKSSPGPVLQSAIRLLLSGGVYVPKELIEAGPAPPMHGVRSAPRDTASLSPRQRDVLRLIAEGKTNADIGKSLAIAPGTVKSHVRRVFEELGVGNRTEAAIRYREMRDDDER
jgi:DNA-binding NarL/FixJ family response regulator